MAMTSVLGTYIQFLVLFGGSLIQGIVLHGAIRRWDEI
jgi:flagellar motor component MotA